MAKLSINFDDISDEQLIALGDATLRMGHSKLALAIYERAARAPTIGERWRALVRVGLARKPGGRTLANLDALEGLETLPPRSAYVADGLATYGKTLWFFDDPRFMEVEARHRDLLPLANWHWNLGTVLWAVQQVKDLDGDFVELGVFKGHTTLFCADYLDFASWRQSWTLFDTFEGIPEDQLDTGWDETNARVYKDKFSYEEVRDRFLGFPNIRVVKGRVPEVLEGAVPDRISFIHMDMNNATAEVAALDALYDRIVPGGVIVFDDYMWLVSHKQFEAEKAWFAARGLVVLPLPTGQGVFVKPAA